MAIFRDAFTYKNLQVDHMLSKLIATIFKVIIIVTVPFILLVRGAVHMHNASDYLPWVCIAGGMLMAMAIVFIYLSFIHRLFVTGDGLPLKMRLFITLFIVGTYVAHGVFYISTENMKSDALRAEMRDVHPLIRLAVSTLIHLDKSLVITDADREPEDYQDMGLKSPQHSLHYKQYTGYSHAMDLRTRSRPEWQNLLVRNYFRLMGFRTLRHHGTADHLHISLMSHDHPYAK